MSEPWLAIPLSLPRQPGVAELPDDAARWAWVCCELAAKPYEGTFPSEGVLVELMGSRAHHLPAFRKAGLLRGLCVVGWDAIARGPRPFDSDLARAAGKASAAARKARLGTADPRANRERPFTANGNGTVHKTVNATGTTVDMVNGVNGGDVPSPQGAYAPKKPRPARRRERDYDALRSRTVQRMKGSQDHDTTLRVSDTLPAVIAAIPGAPRRPATTHEVTA